MCLILDVISTVFFQAPWNLALGAGKDVELMQKITDTNWVRVFLESAQVVVVFIMMSKLYLKLSEPISSSATVTRA